MTSDQKIRGYILGKLSGDDAERLEVAYFSSGAAFDETRAVEDELIEAYVDGDLTGDERRALEAGVLASAAGQRRLQFFRALAVRADRRGVMPASWWQTLAAWLWPANVGARVAWVGAMAVLLAVGAMQLAGPDSDAQRAALASLELSPISVRAPAEPAVLAVGDGVEFVEIVLHLDAQESFDHFEAVLRQGKREAWRSGKMIIKDLALTVRVPASSLTTGRIEVELLGLGQGAPEAIAYFSAVIAKR